MTPPHRRIFPESEVSDDQTYIVVGVDKREGSKREAHRGTYDACADYADRNESPDNYERYYVGEITPTASDAPVRELTVVHQPAPMDGFALVTAKLTVRGGKEAWLCNSFSELTEAMGAGEPFTAHEVIGMKPSPIIINPAHVATISESK